MKKSIPLAIAWKIIKCFKNKFNQVGKKLINSKFKKSLLKQMRKVNKLIDTKYGGYQRGKG